jgi:hypothetical protein|tara:strand:+ start:76 stop:291 length:216 start_codon:yes stop_codon:yes gene_type:complete
MSEPVYYQDAIDSLNLSIRFCKSMQDQAKNATREDYIKMHITFISDIINEFEDLKEDLSKDLNRAIEGSST